MSTLDSVPLQNPDFRETLWGATRDRAKNRKDLESLDPSKRPSVLDQSQRFSLPSLRDCFVLRIVKETAAIGNGQSFDMHEDMLVGQGLMFMGEIIVREIKDVSY